MSSNIPKELLDVYLKSIPEKLAALKKVLEELEKNRGKGELEALRFFVHKLAGNSGTYGFLTVSQICRDAEIKLVAWIEQFPNISMEQIVPEMAKLYPLIEKGFKTTS